MNNFPFSDSPLPRRRLSPRIVVAALGVGILVGGFIVMAVGSLVK